MSIGLARSAPLQEIECRGAGQKSRNIPQNQKGK
jgi:hypothetical protein